MGLENIHSQSCVSAMALIGSASIDAARQVSLHMNKTAEPKVTCRTHELDSSSRFIRSSFSSDSALVPTSASDSDAAAFLTENFFLYKKRTRNTDEHEKKRDYFTGLPEEIILRIFKHLSKQAVLRCGRVCHKFNRCSRDESLWKRLDLGRKSLRAGALGDILPRGVEVLRLSQSRVRYPTFDFHYQIPTYRTNLQYLDLSMCTITEPSLEMLLKHCRKLKKLSLENVEVTDYICDEIAQNVDLEELNLSMATGLDEWGVRQMMVGLQKLRSLNVAWTDMDFETVLNLVENVTPHLLRLNISGCKDVMCDHHVRILSERCPELIELDLSDCNVLSTNSMFFITQMKNLEYLSVSRLYNMWLTVFIELRHLPKLKYVNAFGLLSHSLAERLQEELPYLKVNMITGCSTVARPTVGRDRKTSIWGIETQR